MTDETLIADLIRGGVDPDLVQRVALAMLEAQGTAQVAILKDDSAERRRAADRERKAEIRASVRRNPQTSTESADKEDKTLPLSPSLPLPPQTPPSPAHPHTPAPVPTHVREDAAVLILDQPEPKPAKTAGKGTQAELEAYAVEIGLPASDGTAMFDHWTANGWRNGSTPSKCWKAGMRKWKGQNWMPSQKAPRQNGFNGQRQPKHAAYNAETATLGLTGDQIGKF